MHVLLVDADIVTGRRLQRDMAANDVSSEWLRDFGSAQAMMATDPDELQPRFDCILLTNTLPDGDGIRLLRDWRSRSIHVPVIVISERDSPIERAASLDAGADDHLVKPVAAVELASRVRAIARRRAGHASPVWRFGELEVDTHRRKVHVAGNPVTLSPMEYRIIVALASAPSSVVPKARLAQAMKPLSEPMELGVLEWHIWNLRRKIGATRIRTVRGVGYEIAQS